MDSYLIYKGKKITLAEYLDILGPEPGTPGVRLADKKPGDVAKIGKFEMIVLDQSSDATFLLTKEAYCKCAAFGKDNNFPGSFVDKKCQEFAEDLKEIVGANNVITHVVNLNNTHGVTKCGHTIRDASLLSLDIYCKYRDIINQFKMLDRWWLVTPYGATDREVCRIRDDGWFHGNCIIGCDVRPFCMLKPDIILNE